MALTEVAAKLDPGFELNVFVESLRSVRRFSAIDVNLPATIWDDTQRWCMSLADAIEEKARRK